MIFPILKIKYDNEGDVLSIDRIPATQNSEFLTVIDEFKIFQQSTKDGVSISRFSQEKRSANSSFASLMQFCQQKGWLNNIFIGYTPYLIDLGLILVAKDISIVEKVMSKSLEFAHYGELAWTWYSTDKLNHFMEFVIDFSKRNSVIVSFLDLEGQEIAPVIVKPSIGLILQSLPLQDYFSYSYAQRIPETLLVRSGLCGLILVPDNLEGKMLYKGSREDYPIMARDKIIPQVSAWLEQFYLLSPHGLYYTNTRKLAITSQNLIDNNRYTLEALWENLYGNSSKIPEIDTIRLLSSYAQKTITELTNHQPIFSNQLTYIDAVKNSRYGLNFSDENFQEFDFNMQIVAKAHGSREVSQEAYEQVRGIISQSLQTANVVEKFAENYIDNSNTFFYTKKRIKYTDNLTQENNLLRSYVLINQYEKFCEVFAGIPKQSINGVVTAIAIHLQKIGKGENKLLHRFNEFVAGAKSEGDIQLRAARL